MQDRVTTKAAMVVVLATVIDVTAAKIVTNMKGARPPVLQMLSPPMCRAWRCMAVVTVRSNGCHMQGNAANHKAMVVAFATVIDATSEMIATSRKGDASACAAHVESSDVSFSDMHDSCYCTKQCCYMQGNAANHKAMVVAFATMIGATAAMIVTNMKGARPPALHMLSPPMCREGTCITVVTSVTIVATYKTVLLLRQ